MFGITSHILESQEDKKVFHEKSCRLIKVDFPFQYFDESFIRAFKNKDGKIIGGFVLVRGNNLRTIESIPTEIDININKTFEVTGMWLDPSLRSGILSLRFWLQFSRDVYNQKDMDHYVYAYGLENKKLKQLYSHAAPKVLYQGRVKKLAGNKEESFECIEIALRSRIGYMPIYGCFSLLCKLVLRRKMFFRNVFYKRKNWVRT